MKLLAASRGFKRALCMFKRRFAMKKITSRVSAPWGLFLVPAMLCLLAATAPASAQRPPIDRESLECIGCHDAAVSPEDPMRICHEAGCGHRIGVDYAEAASRDRSLAPLASLPPELKLADGRVACTTCHVPYSKDDHEALSARRTLMPEIPDPMLSVDNAGSGLCLSCHLK